MYNKLLAQAVVDGSPIADTVTGAGAIYDPNFLNLRFFFNQVIVIGTGFFDFIVSLFENIGVYDTSGIENILWGISVLFIIGTGYCLFKLWEIYRNEQGGYKERQLAMAETVEEGGRNAGWRKVLDYLDLPNESDWRLGIIEADNLLGTMLETQGYHGESIGERLKGVEPSDFLSLSKAWEAHKIRNRIAHEGLNFSLTRREAQRVVNMYRDVFEEFHFI